MKNYLKKNGIKLIALVLAVAIVAGVGSVLMKGRTGLIGDALGSARVPVQRMVSSLAHWLESVYGYVFKYDSLIAENERLQGELVKAQEEIRNGKEALEENERLRNLLEFREKSSSMTLESAKIVSWTSSNWANTFTVSKGEEAGLELGDGVINEYGVLVGQVIELGSNWATVRTVVDINTNIGVLIENGSSGLLTGDFTLMRDGLAKITYLADGTQIFSGEKIMTSGSGGAFPQGLVVGTVDSVQSEAGGQIAYGLVAPDCDLNALVQVFIIKDFEVVE